MKTAEKRQNRKVGVAGGFINQMMGNNATLPKVGEGATELMYSDRHAYEVTFVSKDGMSCKIRPMNCENIGQCYGDERYTYTSNPEGHETTLEWSNKKGQWGKVSHSIEIQKSIVNKLVKQYGYGWSDYLPNGIKYDDLVDGEKNGMYTKLKLIPGITKQYKNFHKISIIFGVMEEYRDPSF